jgi:hypothetical protein
VNPKGHQSPAFHSRKSRKKTIKIMTNATKAQPYPGVSAGSKDWRDVAAATDLTIFLLAETAAMLSLVES